MAARGTKCVIPKLFTEAAVQFQQEGVPGKTPCGERFLPTKGFQAYRHTLRQVGPGLPRHGLSRGHHRLVDFMSLDPDMTTRAQNPPSVIRPLLVPRPPRPKPSEHGGIARREEARPEAPVTPLVRANPEACGYAARTRGGPSRHHPIKNRYRGPKHGRANNAPRGKGPLRA